MDLDIQDRILEKLQTRGPASASELAELLDCTEGEVHVGLHQLSKQKLIELKLGGRWVVVVQEKT